jgi:phage terminase Nu1 subunit (DNA packaging protein)
MHIQLPNGDTLVPDGEIADELDVVRRTLGSWDQEGCPFVMVGGRKYRPRNETLAWLASRIKRFNPRRGPGRPRKTAAEVTA